MGLFKPAWMSKNKKRALAAVNRLSDQAKLLCAAKEAPYRAVSMAAVRKLRDQPMLAALATASHDQRVQRLAINRLTDQALLTHIALDKGVIDYVRFIAANELADHDAAQQVYLNLAKFNKEDGRRCNISDIGFLALMRLDDQDFVHKELHYIATHSDRLWKAAVVWMKDQATLAEFAINDESGGEKGELAVQRIHDQSQLAAVAANAKADATRIAALKKLEDLDAVKHADIPQRIYEKAREQ